MSKIKSSPKLTLLRGIVDTLHTKLSQTEICCRRFMSSLSRDYCSRILALRKVSSVNFHHYLQAWFRSYLACKDEIMILIQGAVYRRYHAKEHEIYKHSRNTSSSSSSLTTSSVCSSSSSSSSSSTSSSSASVSGCEARFCQGCLFLSQCSADGITFMGKQMHANEVS